MCTSILSIALVAAVAIPAAACSSQDPGAVTFAPNRNVPQTSGDSPAADSGAPPPADTSADSGAIAPPAADASADVSDAGAMDAADASDAPSGPAVVSVTLIDTSVTNVVQGSPVPGYDPIKDGGTISLAQVGNNLSIRANLNVATIGSVGFVYDQTNHTENATPYMLCGDNGAGTINNCNLQPGAHKLTVTPYSQANLGGTAGTPLTITFTIQ